jgi:hypothetical protein
MPISTYSEPNRPTYLKIKNKLTYKNSYNRDVEGYAIAKYNPDTTQEEFVTTKFNGHLANIEISEEKTGTSKTGKEYAITNIFYEFQSYDDSGNLVREILTGDYNSQIAKKIIGKLAACKMYSSIHLEFGVYNNKQTGEAINTVSVWEGVPHLEVLSQTESLFITDEQYRKNPEQKLLPKKRYLKKEGKNFVITENWEEALEGANKMKMVDPDWQIEVDTAYREAVVAIKGRLTSLPVVSPNKATIPATSVVNSTLADEVYTDGVEADLPKIDMEDINLEIPF